MAVVEQNSFTKPVFVEKFSRCHERLKQPVSAAHLSLRKSTTPSQYLIQDIVNLAHHSIARVAKEAKIPRRTLRDLVEGISRKPRMTTFSKLISYHCRILSERCIHKKIIAEASIANNIKNNNQNIFRDTTYRIHTIDLLENGQTELKVQNIKTCQFSRILAYQLFFEADWLNQFNSKDIRIIAAFALEEYQQQEKENMRKS